MKGGRRRVPVNVACSRRVCQLRVAGRIRSSLIPRSLTCNKSTWQSDTRSTVVANQIMGAGVQGPGVADNPAAKEEDEGQTSKLSKRGTNLFWILSSSYQRYWSRTKMGATVRCRSRDGTSTKVRIDASWNGKSAKINLVSCCGYLLGRP